LFALPKKIDPFEPQHPARATVDTLTASQAIRIDHVLSKPDIPADVNADGAIKCANTALHTAGWFGNNMPTGKDFAPARSKGIFSIRHDLLTIRPSTVTRKLYQQQTGNLIHLRFSYSLSKKSMSSVFSRSKSKL
jgi:hypothetical protein